MIRVGQVYSFRADGNKDYTITWMSSDGTKMIWEWIIGGELRSSITLYETSKLTRAIERDEVTLVNDSISVFGTLRNFKFI